MVQNQDLNRYPGSGIRILSAASCLENARTQGDTSKNMILVRF
jgi:hypothetical protein